MAEIQRKMDEERAEQEALQEKMRLEYEAKMKEMQDAIAAKQDDEEAKRQAEEAEAKMRIEMEFKIEQEKLKQ